MSDGKGDRARDDNSPAEAPTGERFAWRATDEGVEPAPSRSGPHTYPGIDLRVFNVAPADKDQAHRELADGRAANRMSRIGGFAGVARVVLALVALLVAIYAFAVAFAPAR